MSRNSAMTSPSPQRAWISHWPARLAIALSVVPVGWKVYGWFSGVTTLPLWFALYLFLWIILVAGSLWQSGQLKSIPRQVRTGIIGYAWLLTLPCLLLQAFLIGEPYYLERTVKAALAASLLPLGWFCVAPRFLTGIFAGNHWTKTLLMPVLSGTFSLLIADAVLTLTQSPIWEAATRTNDPSRRYWYFNPSQPSDREATSYGFLGSEPDTSFKGTRVLLIGDSMPAAGYDYNFPGAAETLLRSEGNSIRVVNAGMGGYSLEQIKLFYEERLHTLPHDILVLSFYIDDINRSLRYVRGNVTYTPSWPQWLQDIYYFSTVGKGLLHLCGTNDHEIQTTRTATYQEAFPEALTILDEIRLLCHKRGVKFAVFNVPRCTWSDRLTSRADYPTLEYDLALADWCRKKNVPYKSALDPFLGKPIMEYMISQKDRHYNHAGHTLVANELSVFLDPMCTSLKRKQPQQPNQSTATACTE